MKMVEFVADFNGSENIQIEGRNNLITVTNIEPYSRKPIATLVLHRDWKLKSKFKFTLKTPSIEIQEKFLIPHIEEITKEFEHSEHLLKKTAIQNMTISDANKILVSHNIKFLDITFPPNDVSRK